MEELKEIETPKTEEKPSSEKTKYRPAIIYCSGKDKSIHVITIPVQQIRDNGWQAGDLIDTSELKKIGRKVTKVEYD